MTNKYSDRTIDLVFKITAVSCMLLLVPFACLCQACTVDAGMNVIICPGQSVTLGGNPTLVSGWDQTAVGWDKLNSRYLEPRFNT